MKLEGWSAWLAVRLGYVLVELLARTLRFEVRDELGVIGQLPERSYIGVLWHNRLLIATHVLRRFVPQRRGAALISASRDGTLIADLVHCYGYETVRGSTSRKGASALLKMAEVLARGHDGVITPDGPRGPVYELGQGVIFLAQKSGALITHLQIEYSSCWRLNSWDRFIIPKPFSTVRMVFRAPYQVQPTSTDTEYEAERRRLQEYLLAGTEQR